MDTFGFTKKKFLSLSIESQNKQIIKWLSSLYQKLITNRLSISSLENISVQYNQILEWMGTALFKTPQFNNTVTWIEVLSDRIHFHRLSTGIVIRDHNLLEPVNKPDGIHMDQKIDIECKIALDGMRSLFNVGSIFRTAEAAGFNSIILGNTLGKEHPHVKKTAMGSHSLIHQEKTQDLAGKLFEEKENGFHIIGVETIKNSRPYYDIAWKKKTIVVFGNEEYGISSHVCHACDEFTHIPMFGSKNSINVANAASVVCFDMAKSIF